MRLAKILAHPMRALFYLYFTLIGLGARRPIQIIGRHGRPFLTWKIFRILRLRETSGPADLAFQNIDATRTKPSTALNGRCTDISKSRVAEVFARTFGYDLAVNPLTHCGPMVEKSDDNAAHDGRIVNGPIAATRPGCVYHRLVDNITDDGQIEDLRACVIGDEIPFVYRKRRPLNMRFQGFAPDISHCSADEAFTQEEQSRIVAFAKEMGIDIGELDTLRNHTDGRLYIVDANKTPASPAASYFSLGAIICMHRAAAAFRRQFLSSGARVHTDVVTVE